ncbi:MAG: hypothetical protein IKY39_03310 [Clostridia bacterium]|nr:hypothetical protein [Clostridia bacterium]
MIKALSIIFIILKLVGVITWSWWLVLIPVYIWLALEIFCKIVEFMMWKL